MINVMAIKADIKSLRGNTVRVFGQPTELDEEVNEVTIDVLDVLDRLQEDEVVDMYIPTFDEDGDINGETEAESIDEYLNFLEEHGMLEVGKADNTFNWSAPVSNDINFEFYSYEGETLVVIKVHRFGDVRGNYTEEALLKYANEDDFLHALLECNKYVELAERDGTFYNAEVNIFNDGYEVFTDDGEYVTEVYGTELEELRAGLMEFLNDRKK